MPRPPRKPESELPEVEVYTWTYASHLEAVLCFRHHIDPQRATTALQQAVSYNRRGGEEPLGIMFRAGHVVLVDERDTHSPARMLTHAKNVAEFMRYSTKPIAPPGTRR